MRPVRSHLDVLGSQLELEGAAIVDVGCGAGVLTRRVARAGAQVTGVDPSEGAIMRARAAASPRERYLLGGAEKLPVPDASADAVTFLNSLHHVPVPSLALALSEAGRVLRQGGVVYVQEPLAEGPYFEVVRLVEDETEARAAAQRALAYAGRAGLLTVIELEYDAPVRHRDFASFRDVVVLADQARARRLAELEPELEQRFRGAGEHGPDGWTFHQPTRVTVLRRPDSGSREEL